MTFHKKTMCEKITPKTSLTQQQFQQHELLYHDQSNLQGK